MSAISVGMQFENAATSFLAKSNVEILQRNFRCKYGEIDLIAKQDNILLFIEVRYRKSLAFGGALESITYNKCQKIIRAAEYYLQNNIAAQQLACRFDVIAITNSTHNTQIEWIKDAFNV